MGVFMEKDLKKEKKAQRREAADRLKGLSTEYVDSASKSIARALIDTPEYRDAGTIFCYMNFGKEVVTDLIIADALSSGKRVCIPLCRGAGIMDARLYTGETQLVPGAFGIMEPSTDEPVVSPEEIDLAVVPCVTCDRELRRLGHGAGYYDRFFQEFKGTKIALCLEEMLLDEVVTEEHDVRMDMVISEEKIYDKDSFGEHRRWRP